MAAEANFTLYDDAERLSRYMRTAFVESVLLPRYGYLLNREVAEQLAEDMETFLTGFFAPVSGER